MIINGQKLIEVSIDKCQQKGQAVFLGIFYSPTNLMLADEIMLSSLLKVRLHCFATSKKFANFRPVLAEFYHQL